MNWIKVTDALPPDRAIVLCSFNDEPMVSVCIFQKHGAVWYDFVLETQREATYWAPKPAPAEDE